MRKQATHTFGAFPEKTAKALMVDDPATHCLGLWGNVLVGECVCVCVCVSEGLATHTLGGLSDKAAPVQSHKGSNIEL